jgi:hypothetical protein
MTATNKSSEVTIVAPAGPPSEEELATVLDGILDGLREGKPIDCDNLLRRYPQLADALEALGCLGFTPPAAPALAAESRVGPYLLECELGVGGFGTVYRAHDPGVRRTVAVKLLHPGRLAQPEVVARFQRETRVTAQLSHPGIVRLLDFSRTGPPHFLVTEYIEGVDPCRWCHESKASLREVVRLVAQIAEAVDHAHQRGVFHRDLKPANILIDSVGVPHVLDFGLARVLGVEDSQAHTEDGCVLGSLAYMAPEQAAGESNQADARSDVYSLGVILFELLTGELPFKGPLHSLPNRVMEEEPARPRGLKPSIPRVIEAVCLKAMAKRPDHRYPSAGVLAKDLNAWLGGDAVEARQVGWLSRVGMILGRRHRDLMPQGWPRLLLLVGLTILVGCSVANYWELTLPGGQRFLPMLLTKISQVALMLYLAFRFRPLEGPRLTAAERQIWTLIPAYYGSLIALVVVNLCLEVKIPLAPVLAILSGMGFMSLGATIWGWFYVWGTAFYLLAILIALGEPYGLTILGVGWCLSLMLGAQLLRA